jgi:lipopolysaccharide export LptBFGC system permease protein LptF
VGTLDRYVAKQYLVNVVALLLLLNVFVVVTSVSLNFDDFLESARASQQPGAPSSSLRDALAALLLVLDIWAPRLVHLYVFLNGFVLVGAMGFTFAQLVRHRELVAMMAGGVPLQRAARGVFIVAASLLGVQVLVQELAVPHLAPLLTRSDRDAGKRDFAAFGLSLVPDGQRRLLMARTFDPSTSTIEGLYVLQRDAGGRAVSRLTAERATWNPATASWKLTQGEQRQLRAAPGAGGRAVVQPVAELAGTLDPDALLSHRYRTLSQTMSSPALLYAASLPGVQQDLKDQVLRVFWGRISGVVSTALSLVISLPFFLTREPRNMVTQALKAAPVALGCLVGGVLGSAAPIPTDLLPIAVGAFLPALLMLPVAIAQGTSIKT